MTLINNTRKGCKDVFRSYLVKTAKFASELEIPIIEPVDIIPERLIPFSAAISSNEFDSWVHFYEDDVNFERIWNNPNKYLPILMRFNGVILPDFSVYRDMPLVMQYWNIYRSRAIGHWLQENGIHVIPNIRFGDERTYQVCCAGISRGSVIAIGSHGCIKIISERQLFAEGLAYIVNCLKPKSIVVYGKAPDSIFSYYKQQGIGVIQFESDCAKSHFEKEGDANGRR